MKMIMKNYMLKLLLPLFFVLAAATQGKAQYDNAIGLRLWYYPGITFKHHISEPAALEFILDTRRGAFNLTGLYEHHFPLGPENLNLYVGGGAHVGYYRYNDNNKYWGEYNGGAYLGVDGIVGLEYTFEAAPINLSLDWKPAFDLLGYRHFWGDGGALSVRYAF
jgi:hypothetical protein